MTDGLVPPDQKTLLLMKTRSSFRAFIIQPHRAMFRFAASLGLASLVVGCVNLSAVRDFAKASKNVAGVTEITRDYYDTLERRNLFAIEPGRKVSQPSLDARKAEVKRLLEAQAVLVEYMNSLEALADNDLIAYNKSLDKLGGSLVKAELTTAAQVAPYKIAVGLLARLFTDHYRQSTLKKIVPGLDPAVQQVCTNLAERIEQEYTISLDNEQEQMNSYLKRAAADGGGTKLLVQLQLRERETAFTSRKERAAKAIEAYKKIGEAHAYLSRNIDKVGVDEIKQQLLSYKDDLEAAYNIVKGDS